MQIPFRCNLSAASFPLVSDWMGRSVIIPQYDQNFVKVNEFSGKDADADIQVPQVFYCHNVMPTAHGYRAVTYESGTHGVLAAGADERFSYQLPVRDPLGNKSILAVTTANRIFLLGTNNTWIDVTPVGFTGQELTTAEANGTSYVCLAFTAFYKVNVVSTSLVPVTLTGLNSLSIKGIASASNYLIAYTETSIAWSAASNPEDFIPSLTTGAGSGVPTGMQGKVVTLTNVNIGFAVYTDTNVVVATYSGNLKFPWIFKPVFNSQGVLSKEHVAVDADSGVNYAWTFGGLLRVSLQGCQQVFTEVTDFLSGELFEDFDYQSLEFIRTEHAENFPVKVTFVGSRYLVISYGISALTHALVYDTAIQRWGKLRIEHVDCFDSQLDLGYAPITYADLAGETYSSLSNFVTYSGMAAHLSQITEAKDSMYFLQANGAVKRLHWDYHSLIEKLDAVLILGKYQLTRLQVGTVQAVDVENVKDMGDIPIFDLFIFSSHSGKEIDEKITRPKLVSKTRTSKRYQCRVTAQNHSLCCIGAFNLTSLTLTLSRHGRR